MAERTPATDCISVWGAVWRGNSFHLETTV